jgi:hypothetical protein
MLNDWIFLSSEHVLLFCVVAIDEGSPNKVGFFNGTGYSHHHDVNSGRKKSLFTPS